jgi:hypothetical protein
MADLPELPDAMSDYAGGMMADVGHEVTYACYNGYRSFSRCLESGLWDQPRPCSEWEISSKALIKTVSGCPRGYRRFMNTNETIELESQGYDGESKYLANQTCSWRFVRRKA